jgi:hypothetical protein
MKWISNKFVIIDNSLCLYTSKDFFTLLFIGLDPFVHIPDLDLSGSDTW